MGTVLLPKASGLASRAISASGFHGILGAPGRKSMRKRHGSLAMTQQREHLRRRLPPNGLQRTVSHSGWCGVTSGGYRISSAIQIALYKPPTKKTLIWDCEYTGAICRTMDSIPSASILLFSTISNRG